MKNKIFFFLLFTFIFQWGKPQKKSIIETYTNPVLSVVFPDPAIIRDSLGMFYAFATNGKDLNGKMCNIQVASSPDLIHWNPIGDAMPVKADWANKKQEYWAPTVLFDKTLKKYFLYFSAEKNEGGKCIGVATSENTQGPYSDIGQPLVCGEGFVNIDPMAFDDPVTGKKLLYWGSGLKAIKVQELDDTRTHFKPGTLAKDIIPVNQEKDYDILVEGAWTIYRNGFYYLFYSGDNCCGEGTHYAVMVARSKNPMGPFESLSKNTQTNSSVILKLSDQWIGPGHNCIVTDDEGKDWILYHAIRLQNKNITYREMLIDPIVWKNGWPFIENGIPSSTPIPIPKIKIKQ